MSFEQKIYKEMEKALFPQSQQIDFMNHFVCEYSYKGINKNEKGAIQTFSPGAKQSQRLALEPPPGHISRSGREFCCAITRIYNENYWLIKLWLKMYDDSKNFVISREIVRSFIKNCIKITTNEIVSLGETVVNVNNVQSSNLSSQPDYYSKIFNMGQIMSGMRRPQRELLINRYQKNKWHNSAIKNSDSSDSIHYDSIQPILADLLVEYKLDEYINLINICSEFKDDKGIYGVFKTLLLFLRTVSGKKKVRKEISRILNGD